MIAFDLFGDGKTALRGGFGQTFNREMMAHSHKWLVAQPPLVQNPILYHGELKDLLASSGIGFPSQVLSRDRALKNEKIMNFSFGLEQNIGFDTILRTYYVGALGRNLYWRRSLNPVAPGANFDPANADPTRPGNPLPPVFLRPTPGYQDIFYFEGAASSNYHSLQISAMRRFTKGFQFGSAWTWSKAMDYNEDPRAVGAGATVSPFVNPRVWDYGPMSWDRTHVLKLNYLWEVPRVRWSNIWSGYVLNGWQVSGITTFQSGQPSGIGLSTTVARDFTGTASHGARVNHVQNVVLPKSEQTFSRFFNTSAVAMPQVGTFGNASKVLFRGPGINNWDLAIFKSFPIREPFRLQFRCEMYNAFNHTQFSGVDSTTRFDPNGVQVNGRFGEFTAANPARRMQFGLRFLF